MKQSDIFSIILVASIGTFGAFFVCNALMGDPDDKSIKFTTVREVVESKLEQPDSEIFNAGAFNPTVEVYVGDCEDIDQNGILDEAELLQCERDMGDDETEGAEGAEQTEGTEGSEG